MGEHKILVQQISKSYTVYSISIKNTLYNNKKLI